MTARCEPPPEYRHLPWHWLRDEYTGVMMPVAWRNFPSPEWRLSYATVDPETAHAAGIRYHAPAIPPEKPE